MGTPEAVNVVNVEPFVAARRLRGQWPVGEALRILDGLEAHRAALGSVPGPRAARLVLGGAGLGALAGFSVLAVLAVVLEAGDLGPAFFGLFFGLVCGAIVGGLVYSSRAKAHARRLGPSWVGDEAGDFVAPLLRAIEGDLRPASPVELDLDLAPGEVAFEAPAGTERTLATLRVRLDDGNRLALRVDETILGRRRTKRSPSGKTKTKEKVQTALACDLRLSVNGERYRSLPPAARGDDGVASDAAADGLVLRLRVAEKAKEGAPVIVDVPGTGPGRAAAEARRRATETAWRLGYRPYPVPSPERTLSGLVALYSHLAPVSPAGKEG
jgi:hypothetical protein